MIGRQASWGGDGSSRCWHFVRAPASAQKSGGILKIQHWDSPASMSIHEEATYSVVVPMMGVFNNLVMFEQDVPQNSLQVDRPRSRRQLGVERGRQGR